MRREATRTLAIGACLRPVGLAAVRFGRMGHQLTHPVSWLAAAFASPALWGSWPHSCTMTGPLREARRYARLGFVALRLEELSDLPW